RADQWSALEQRPEVADWARLAGVVMLPLGAGGKPDVAFLASPVGSLILANSDGNELHTIDRPGVVAGKIPAREDTPALVVNERAAHEHHLHVGSQLRVGFFRVQDLQQSSPNHVPAPAAAYTLRVAAIVRPFDDATRAADDPRLGASFVLGQSLSQRIA